MQHSLAKRHLNRFLLVFILLWVPVSYGQSNSTAKFLFPPPDPCFEPIATFNPNYPDPPDPWSYTQLNVLNEGARLYTAPVIRQLVDKRSLILIIDGNGFNQVDYTHFAGYLAHKGFNVVVIDRPAENGPDPVTYSLSALSAAFVELNLPQNAPVAIIGHSVGGNIALSTIAQNDESVDAYNIESLVLLSPKLSDSTPTNQLLGGDKIDAVMTIYGSQDNDVGGLTAQIDGAFGAYDRLGSEGSTVCSSGICPNVPKMHRTMVYIHGADHSGLINRNVGVPNAGDTWDPYNNYLSKSDQFCITKGYTLAMLEWTLNDNDTWKSMVSGNHRPYSMSVMTIAQPDELGNPAGSPLRMALQVSHKGRSVIENFEDSTWEISTKTDNVNMQLINEAEWAGTDANIHHATKLALVSWPQHNHGQFIAFTVPASMRNTTAYTGLSFRIGVVASLSDATFSNDENVSPTVFIGLKDGNGDINWEWSNQHGVILPADLRPSGDWQSVMGSLQIPFTAFYNINKKDIQEVFIGFPIGTKGSLMLDSIEWYQY